MPRKKKEPQATEPIVVAPRELHPNDPLAEALTTCRLPATVSFENVWIGLEPTFTSAAALKTWERLTQKPGGEDAFFLDPNMLKTAHRLATSIKQTFDRRRRKGEPVIFDRCVMERGEDEWKVPRWELDFQWRDRSLDSFNVRVGLDPEVCEYSMKPVPLAWFLDDRFIDFLQTLFWDIPAKLGMQPALAHGGGQFHAAAKNLLHGSLLADDIAYRLDHPELACWIMAYPDVDARSFRATKERRRAFDRVLDSYWAGCFHPRAIGVLTAENAYLDRGFDPHPEAQLRFIDPVWGPTGSAREIFQTNFAFGRTVRLRAQNVHPGYWQVAHPDEPGYRADQVMRYSEGNLNRLQIRGELHVKSGKPLEREDAPELGTPLDLTMLTREASWEYRAQSARASARDYAEALLLELNHAQYLQRHPHVRRRPSLHQDKILGDAEDTLRRLKKDALLVRLHRAARAKNLEDSRGRMKTDWIEPETLFWAAWHALPGGEKAEIAGEAIAGFVERVHNAAAADPRDRAQLDPMEPHRHRIHPGLWTAAKRVRRTLRPTDPVRRELDIWLANQDAYLARRPIWSPGPSRPPWGKE
jgi:hypothetical protein